VNYRVGLFCAAGLLAGGVFVSGQIPSQVPAAIPGPRLGSGASITGAFEGWYYNEDGSRTFLVGYYNRNGQQELDIPIGPNNRIEPGGPDLGQPTHFLTGRQWGMFTIAVPKDFDAALADRIQKTLVGISEAQAKTILPNHYTGFVAATHENYRMIEEAGILVGRLKKK